MNAFFDFGATGLDQVIERLGWTLVHSLWQFTLVAMFAAVALRAMRRWSAEARSAVLTGLMVVSVGLPIRTWVWQSSKPVALVTSEKDSPRSSIFSEPVVATESEGVGSLSRPGTGQRSTSEVPKKTSAPAGAIAVSEDAPVSLESVAVVPVAAPQSTWTERTTALLRPWLSWAVAGWALGVVLCSLRPLLGWFMLRRLRRLGVSPAGAEIIAALSRVSSQLGLNRRIEVLQSNLAQVPLVVGYLRPVILLPVSLVSNIPATQLEAILAHELAHIRRHDFVVNLLQIVVETLFFYHPAIWWLSHRIRVEREHCCDDLVVRTMNNRTEYGRALIAIEELRGRHTALALGASDGSLVARIRRIAGLPRERSGVSVASGLSVLALLLGMAVLFGITTNRGLASANGNDPAEDDEVVAETPLPEGSTLRFGTARFRLGGEIEHMAVSSDGKFAVAGRESETRAFDSGSGRSTYALDYYYGLLVTAISPDGKWIVAKGEKSIGIYDAETGKRIRKISSPDDLWAWTEVTKFMPDGNAFAVASRENMKEGVPAAVHLINFKLGKTMRVFPMDNPESDLSSTFSKVLGLAFSPDGRFMATGGFDNDHGIYFARLWNLKSGQEVRRFVHEEHSHGVRSLAFSPDGTTLATRSHDGRLRTFNVATGESIKTFEKDGGGRKIGTVVFSPDGKTLAAAGNSLRLYDTATNEERLRIDRVQVSNLHFTDGGKYLVGAYMGAIYRWDTATGEPQTPVAGDSAISQVFVTPDERRVITHGFLGDAHVWDATSGKHLHRFGARWQRKIAMSADGRFLAWAVRDETIRVRTQGAIFYGTRIRLYDVDNNKIIDRFPGSQSDAGSLAFTADGKQLITIGHRDAVVHVWNFETGKEERSFVAVPDAEKNEPNQVTRAVLSPDGKTLVVEHPPYDDSIVLKDGTIVDRMGTRLARPRPVRLWDIATGKLRVMWGPVSEVNVRGDVAFSPDSRFMVSSNGRVLETATGSQAFTLPHDRSLDATAFSSDGRFLAIAVRDVIQIWDVATWTKREEFKTASHVTSLTFTPGGKLLSGHHDTTVLAWEPPSTSVVSMHEKMQPVRSDELKGIYLGKADDFGVLLRFIGRASRVPGRKGIVEGQWDVKVPNADITSSVAFTDNETTGAIDLHVGLWDGKDEGAHWDQPLGKVERGVSGTLYLTTYRATVWKHYRFLDRIPLRKVSDHKFIQKEDRQLLATEMRGGGKTPTVSGNNKSKPVPKNTVSRPTPVGESKEEPVRKEQRVTDLRRCLNDIAHDLAAHKELSGFTELEHFDAATVRISAHDDHPERMGISFQHKFDGWNRNTKGPIVRPGGVYLHVQFADPSNPSALAQMEENLPAFGVVARAFCAVSLGTDPAFEKVFHGIVRKHLNALPHYRLFDQVDAKIRLELSRLAVKYPQLRQTNFGPLAAQLKFRTDEPAIRIVVGHYQQRGGKSSGVQNPVPAESQYLFEFIVTPSGGPPEQRMPNRDFPRIGLEGSFRSSAGDPNLKRELSALIDKGLAPFLALEAAAAKTTSNQPQRKLPMNADHAEISALIAAGATVPTQSFEKIQAVHRLLTAEERVKSMKLFEEPDFPVEVMILDDHYSVAEKVAILTELHDHEFMSGAADGIVTVATEFAKDDPQAARNWLTKFTGTDYAVGMGLASILEVLHRQDSEASLAMLRSFNDNEAEQLISFADLPDYKLSAAEWMKEVQQFQSQRLKGFYLDWPMVFRFGEESPQAALDYILSLPPDKRNSLQGKQLVGCMTRSGKFTPAEIIDWMTNRLPEESRSPEHYGLLATSWANSDPASFQKWFDELDDPQVRDEVIFEYAGHVQPPNWPETFKLANQITNTNKRRTKVAWVIGAWQLTDPQTALSHLDRADITEEQRTHLKRTIDRRLNGQP